MSDLTDYDGVRFFQLLAWPSNRFGPPVAGIVRIEKADALTMVEALLAQVEAFSMAAKVEDVHYREMSPPVTMRQYDTWFDEDGKVQNATVAEWFLTSTGLQRWMSLAELMVEAVPNT